MQALTLGEFAQRCGGELVNADPSMQLLDFALDHREVAPGSLFLCIVGANFDGHTVAREAINQGAVACLSEQDLGEIPHIRVQNLVEALANYGSSCRSEFSRPVLAITGSNGKTSTKEFAYAAMSSLGEIVKSQGNRNTEYTSPLLWADVTPNTQAVIVEMAMRGSGQIKHLAKIARPTLAIITMIGTAHMEKVGTREGIAAAKAEVLAHLAPGGMTILWREDDFYFNLREQAPGDVMSFGFTPDADCRVVGYRAIDWNSCEVVGQLHGEKFEFLLPTIGKHQALNAAAALCAAKHCGVPLDLAAKNLSNAELPPLRMQITERAGVTILLDNYNASPDSTIAALRTLHEVQTEGKKYAVIGEMRELGELSELGHRQVGYAIAQAPPEAVILYGKETGYILDEALGIGLPPKTLNVADSIAAIREFIDRLQPGDTVLIKGSRALALETALEPEE